MDSGTVHKQWMGQIEDTDKKDAWQKAHNEHNGSVEVAKAQ